MAAKKPKSKDGLQPSKDEFANSKAEKARLLKIKNRYNWVKNDRAAPTRTSHPFSTGQTRAKYTKNVKSPSRAQPKGTQPKGMAAPPRTGPSSGGGAQSSRYGRLTGGGLNKHGR
jgi:hypothetical protein